MFEYFRCKACRLKPFSGLLTRSGYGDKCVLCDSPIEEHEERKAREAYNKDRLAKLRVTRNEYYI